MHILRIWFVLGRGDFAYDLHIVDSEISCVRNVFVRTDMRFIERKTGFMGKISICKSAAGSFDVAINNLDDFIFGFEIQFEPELKGLTE